MDWLNTRAKNEALQDLERVQLAYKQVGENANGVVLKLYAKRKEALFLIDEAVKFLNKDPKCDLEYIQKAADYRASLRLFVEAVQNEGTRSSEFDASSQSCTVENPELVFGSTAAAGAIAGAAFATFGPTAAMAFATTFGSAATGVAISSLSGAAATNAALAWLGGGALAVGGGGMTAGSAILALAGPIGLAIGTATAGFAGIRLASKNKEIAQKATLMANDIIHAKKKLNVVIDDMNAVCDEISSYLGILKERLAGTLMEGKRVHNFEGIVDAILRLCFLINKKFSV